MKAPPKQNAQAGFTLVETVIAVVILAVGLSAAALTFNMALRSVDTNRTQMAVMHFARDQLESLRTVDWTDAALNAGTHTIGNGLFAGTYTVTDVEADLKDITVTVNWVDSMRQGTASTPLTTTFARPLHD